MQTTTLPHFTDSGSGALSAASDVPVSDAAPEVQVSQEAAVNAAAATPAPVPALTPAPVPVPVPVPASGPPLPLAATSLPVKPSALIRAALGDLRKVEALPDIYRVNMDVWHREHRGDAVCEVCLAGSTISQSLGARPGEHRGPEDFDQETTWKLYALNEFRVGNVFDGLCYLDRADLWLGADTRRITEYAVSPAGFHRDMQKLAGDLEAVGL